MSVTKLSRPPLYAIKCHSTLLGIGEVTQYMNFTTGIFEIIETPRLSHVTESLPLVTALYNQDDQNESIEMIYLTRRP